MTTFKRILQIILYTTVAWNAAGQEKTAIVTDRPDQSNTPVLIPKGALQVESGFILEQNNAFAASQTNYSFNNTLIKFGVNGNFELRASLGYQGTKIKYSDFSTTKGMSPLSVGVKIKLADAKGFWPQAAVISNLNLRSSGTPFAPSHTSTDITFACSHELTNRTSFTYNAGVKWSGETPEATFVYTSSIGRSLTKKLGGFLELYGFIPESGEPDHRFDCGFTYQLATVVQYDLSGGIGLSDNSPDYFISTGLSVRLFK